MDIESKHLRLSRRPRPAPQRSRADHCVGWIAAILLCCSSPAFAAIQLTPVVSSGLSNPIFVGHAGDGTNRLFIVEQGGVIKVLQPGASVPTVFLDIHTRTLAGGERGLLGLAFHPQYRTNGRFFVYYTRTGDGAIVVAQYTVSADPNVANTTEAPLLTIPHPTYANHNGGMLAFGPDGNLYIGVGDGGGGNDPDRNAQDINKLLGKILRINVDEPGSYAAPADNPFVGVDGADEIFAVGMRNPWRFSFDRVTGLPWVADVGQGAREEVDTPLVKGGNYGWPVYEGTSCNSTDTSLCIPSNYIFPLFDYDHSLGRCSITGGYVYRGFLGALPTGTYVFGDYCTGEIFAWDGSGSTQLLDTALNISSFGEDEQRELYVVGLGGTISKIAPVSSCSFAIAPTSQDFGSAGGPGNVDVTTDPGCLWTAFSNAAWVHVTAGESGSGNGSVAYSLDVNTSSSARVGTMTIAGQTFTANQAGGGACTYTLTPTRTTIGAAGGTGSVAVSAPAGCAWTATSIATWITITGGSPGNGNGAFNYSVAPYTGRPKSRNGTVTVAGLTFTVKQSR